MNLELTSELRRRVDTHAALADVTRLRIVDLLTSRDFSASELGAALGVPSNLLAHHLKVLERAGLVGRRRSEGDARRAYLSATQLAATLAAPTSTVATGRVVFVCTANTARSHLAAALWRRASTVAAASAGTHPGTEINPKARAAAQRHGLTLPHVRPRALDRTRRDGDLIITVCDRAYEELGPRAWGHWSVPDPVAVGTTEGFDAAYAILDSRVKTLAPKIVRRSAARG
jgi:protein-tyrosine-phosphatase/DNA-binding MarR family transcriptional regulator